MEEKLTETYSKFWKITDIFPVNSVGVVTARDKFATDFEKEALEYRIKKFRNLSIPNDIMRKNFKLKDTTTFNLKKSREKLSLDREWDKHFKKILYRPFDVRHIYYTNIVLERPLYETMRHMMQENLGMITARSNKSSVMNHFFCSEYMTETKCGEHTTQSYLFPLYLYTKGEKKPNLSQRLMEFLEKTYSPKITP
jgi:predicted helicase